MTALTVLSTGGATPTTRLRAVQSGEEDQSEGDEEEADHVSDDEMNSD